MGNEFNIDKVLDESKSDNAGGTAFIHGIGELDGIKACIKVPAPEYSFLYRRELELLVGAENIPDGEEYFDLPLESLLKEGIPASYKELFGSESENSALRMGLRFLREGLLMKHLFSISGEYSSIPRILRLRVIRPGLGNKFLVCPIMEVVGRFDYNFRDYVTSQLQTDPSLANRVRILKLLKPIADDLANAHSLNVIYRDLKLDNIFFDDKRQKAFLGDWALGLVQNDTLDESNSFTTPGFTAPEMLVSSANATNKTDVYSFGIIIACIVLGKEYTDHQGVGEDFMTYIARHLDPYTPAITVKTNDLKIISDILDTSLEQTDKIVSSLRSITKFKQEDRPDTPINQILDEVIILLESFAS